MAWSNGGIPIELFGVMVRVFCYTSRRRDHICCEWIFSGTIPKKLQSHELGSENYILAKNRVPLAEMQSMAQKIHCERCVGHQNPMIP